MFLAGACSAGAGGSRAPGEIVIPTEPAPERSDAAPPPRGEPMAVVDRDDPYLYFVGSWDGLVNGKLPTRLTVTREGRFQIFLPPQSHRPTCELAGQLRVSERVIYFDIAHSTCEAENVGSTLVREVVEKTETELVVRSADTRMSVRYTRHVEP